MRELPGIIGAVTSATLNIKNCKGNNKIKNTLKCITTKPSFIAIFEGWGSGCQVGVSGSTPHAPALGLGLGIAYSAGATNQFHKPPPHPHDQTYRCSSNTSTQQYSSVSVIAQPSTELLPIQSDGSSGLYSILPTPSTPPARQVRSRGLIPGS